MKGYVRDPAEIVFPGENSVLTCNARKSMFVVLSKNDPSRTISTHSTVEATLKSTGRIYSHFV